MATAELAGIQHALGQLYSPTSSAEAKRDADFQLTGFRTQLDSWKKVAFFLSQTSDQFVWWYCLSIYEYAIDNFWVSVTDDERAGLRALLWEKIVSKDTLPSVVLSKLIQVIVNIGRIDWPERYATFFDDVLGLCQRRAQQVVGLKVLAQVCATFGGLTPAAQVSATRASQLKQSMISNAPILLDLLSQWLAAESPADAHGLAVLMQALECLAQLLAWLPPAVTHDARYASLVSSVFQCTQHGTGDLAPLGTMALTVLNELIAPNRVPNTDSHLIPIFQEAMKLLSDICRNPETVQLLEDAYSDHLVDFLKLFTSSHLRKIESYPNAPILEFLALLYEFTLQQSEPTKFMACMEMWCDFVENITLRKDGSINRYSECLLAVVDKLLPRLQLRTNWDLLSQLDNDAGDHGEASDWEQFMQPCREFVAKVAEQLQSQTLGIFWPHFVEITTSLLSLSNFDNYASDVIIATTDTCTILQLAGVLFEYCTSGASVDGAIQMHHRVLEIGNWTGSRLEHGRCQIILKDIFAILLSEASWCSALRSASPQSADDTVVTVFQQSCRFCLTFLEKVLPQKETVLSVLAAQALRSFITALRVQQFATMSEFSLLKALVIQAQSDLALFPSETAVLLFEVLSAACALPWSNVRDTEQLWPTRATQCTELFSGIVHNVETASAPKETLILSFRFLTHTIRPVQSESNQSRAVLYQAVCPSIKNLMVYLSRSIADPDLFEPVLTYILEVVRVFRNQIGNEYLQQIVNELIQLCTFEQLQSVMRTVGNGQAILILQSLLNIISVIVQEPHSVFKLMVRPLMELCTERLYPIIVSMSSSGDLPALFFATLSKAIECNWSFFFASPKLRQLGDPAQPPALQNEDVFVRIFELYLQALSTTDLALFSQIIGAISDLHTRFKLFTTPAFNSSMAPAFLAALLSVLADRSHEVVREQIIEMMYLIASVDWNRFFGDFLTRWISDVLLTEPQKQELFACFDGKEQDLPTFNVQLTHFLDNVTYYTRQAGRPETVNFM